MPKEIKTLTALRGIAAVWVAANHFSGMAGAGTSAMLWDASFAVDLFFILSGLVIAYVHAGSFRQRLSWAHVRPYLFKRLARIYPAYFCVLTIFAIAVLGRFVRHPEFYPRHTLAAQYLMIQSWGIVDGWGWVMPLWSVSAEFFAYLLFPLLALLFARRLLGVAVLAAICVVFFAAPYGDVYGFPALIRVTAEFGVGMFLGGSLASPWLKRFGTDAALCGVAVLAVLFVVLVRASAFPPGLFLVPGALLVGGLAVNAGRIRTLLSHGAFQYAGRISYSLYLTHALSLLAADRVAPPGSWGFAAAYFVLAWGFAMGCYHLVEYPARAFLLRLYGAGEAKRIA